MLEELYEFWREPVNEIVPTLEEGEPPMFEAVWKLVDKADSTYYKVRRWLSDARR